MTTVLITGANRGLGLEFTRQYAADGWTVIACCRSPENADSLCKWAKENAAIHIEKLDVSDDQSIAALTDRLDTVVIDVLINNAGIFSGTGKDGKHFPDSTSDRTQNFGTLDAPAWEKVLRVNTIAPFILSQSLLPNLRLAQNAKIIMISSGIGSITENIDLGSLAYRASKAALNAVMHNVAITLVPDNITIASLRPGWVNTDMGGAYANMTPEQSVTAMRNVISDLKQEQSGAFLNYDGQIFPW